MLSNPEFQQRWNDIQNGDVLAWSRHKTGYDENDKFKSVATIHGSSAKANGDTRHDDEVWVVVERDGGTYIEQFQSENWGEDSDYCWFVDSGIGEWAYTPEVPEVPEVPAIPPAQIRPEAYVISNNVEVTWLDSSYNVLDYEILAGNVCCSVDVTTAGIVVVGHGAGITRWDADLVADNTLFTPTGGWPGGEWVGDLEFTDDEQYLYAKTNLGRLYKFNAITGAEEWKIVIIGSSGYSLTVDSSDNVYTRTAEFVKTYDSDGNLIATVGTGGIGGDVIGYLTRDIYVDEDNSRIYTGGATNNMLFPEYIQIGAIDTDGTDWNYYQSDINLSTFWGVIKIGDYVYAAGDRSSGGYLGANASVYKFDSALNIVASYDTELNSFGIFQDHNDNIIVMSGYYASGDTNAGIWILDTDLNYIADYRVLNDVIYGMEGGKIPYLDSGTPAVPAVPAVPGYWTPGLSHIEGGDVCVYADGIPLGVYAIDSEGGIDGLDETAYDVLIAGINYYSTYESFPLQFAYETNIHRTTIDFYESLGSNIGVSRDDSEDWLFSQDDFATKLDLVTEIKEAPFLWGTTRDPVVYSWIWKPIPMTIRAINVKMEAEIE